MPVNDYPKMNDKVVTLCLSLKYLFIAITCCTTAAGVRRDEVVTFREDVGFDDDSSSSCSRSLSLSSAQRDRSFRFVALLVGRDV